MSISGEVVCRADLEGLPDVTVPLLFPRGAGVRALSVHPNAQVLSIWKITLCFGGEKLLPGARLK